MIWELDGKSEFEQERPKKEPKVIKSASKDKQYVVYMQKDLSCIEFINGPKKGKISCAKKGLSLKPDEAIQEAKQLKLLFNKQNKKTS